MLPPTDVSNISSLIGKMDLSTTNRVARAVCSPVTNPQTGLKVTSENDTYQGQVAAMNKYFEHPDGSLSHATEYVTWKGSADFKTLYYNVVTKDKEGKIVREIKTGALPIRKQSTPESLKSLLTIASKAVVKNEAIHPADFHNRLPHLQESILNQAVASGKTEYAAGLLKTRFVFDRAARALIKLGIVKP